MAFPIQLPHVVTEHMNVGAPGNNIGPGARGREKRWTRYAEHNRPKGRPSQPRSLLGRANFGSDGTESSEGPDRLRTNPRQIRRNPYPEERVADGDEPGKHGRLVGRQSNSPVIGEGVNPGGPGGTGVGNGIGNGNGNGVGNGVANGVANGNGNGTGNALPLPGTEEDEEESESEDEELEEETDDDLESEAEDEVDEEEDDNALEEEPAVPESTQGQNKGKISPTQTGSIDIEPSQTAAAIVTSAAPTIAATTAACDASVSPSSDQCEGPEPDLLQPFQKAAIATGATSE
ncbi:hypothetical protein FQN54_006634 [Arachnomyces sp. PD_36]|nr:hypothetical protein FQN54_006634 [Arachnomyces sp. PD_36]